MSDSEYSRLQRECQCRQYRLDDYEIVDLIRRGLKAAGEVCTGWPIEDRLMLERLSRDITVSAMRNTTGCKGFVKV